MPHLRLDAKEARALSVFLLRDQLHNPQSLAADPGEEPGLGFAYYEIDGLNALPNFEDLTAHAEGSTDQITLNLPVSKRNNNYAIRYVGQPPRPKVATFISISDDGSRIVIDGQVVVDNDGIHGRRARNGNINLSAGLMISKSNSSTVGRSGAFSGMAASR